ncbi:helix-turn-helix domain-containing protein [Aliarcobacter butzleri]|uniref:helix-turn-helix domain-containing protein n=1 Tax=Aliarcobacter butzleri TaxID=28197 RepID=UPI001EDBE856|nr:helix-turn-helix transcriptional regulator [Aliarcobacter butzleri]MCG3701318.1 helix-turn-helix domain-containing protein [Aliarcobacter butzleri]
MIFFENEIDEFYIKIGRNVKKYREKKGLTQLQLSYEMNYKSVSLVSAAELYKNKKHFNLEHLYKISKILEIDIEILLK